MVRNLAMSGYFVDVPPLLGEALAPELRPQFGGWLACVFGSPRRHEALLGNLNINLAKGCYNRGEK